MSNRRGGTDDRPALRFQLWTAAIVAAGSLLGGIVGVAGGYLIADRNTNGQVQIARESALQAQRQESYTKLLSEQQTLLDVQDSYGEALERGESGIAEHKAAEAELIVWQRDFVSAQLICSEPVHAVLNPLGLIEADFQNALEAKPFHMDGATFNNWQDRIAQKVIDFTKAAAHELAPSGG